MKRRELLSFLGGAVVWPLAVHAQPIDRLRRIGVLMGIAESDPEGRARVAALREGLEQFALKDGHGVQIDYRWTNGDAERVRTFAANLIALAPDVILATNTATARALQQSTRTIPIVFVSVSDPVGDGFVSSLAKPGGNLTGFSSYEPGMAGKWLQLLKEIAPDVGRIGLIFNPDTTTHSIYLPTITAAAATVAVKLASVPIRDVASIKAAIEEVGRQPAGGLIVLPDSLTVVHRALITGLAERHRLPAVYPLYPFAVSGGLMSYGTDTVDQYRQVGSYIARILKGERPSDLPVAQPTKFQLAINVRAAKAIGVTVPQTLLASADEVIE